jgi:hypothetical protein
MQLLVLNSLVEILSWYTQISKALGEYPAKPSVHKMDKYNLAVLDEKMCLV